MRTLFLVYADSNVENVIAIFNTRVDADAYVTGKPLDVVECTVPSATVLNRQTIDLS
jgi:hypothetical protein